MNTVKCPNCGYDNLSTNIRCVNCGEKLIIEEQVQDIDLNVLLNTQQDSVHNVKIESFVGIFNGIINTIKGIILSVVSSMFVFRGTNNITKIVGIPFLICGIVVLIYGISIIVRGIIKGKNANDYVNGNLDMEKVEKSENNFRKIGSFVNYIYIFGFLLFWFGFLIVFDTVAIKSWSDGGSLMFFFSLIFWVVGIHMLLKTIKKCR